MTVVKELQPIKALFPIVVTELGMVREVIELKLENVASSIVVMEVGMVREVKERQA